MQEKLESLNNNVRFQILIANTLRSFFTNADTLATVRATLTYLSIPLFIVLATVASFSVKQYVRETMSITLADITLSDRINEQQNSEEETAEESSVTILVKKGDTLKAILTNQAIATNDVAQIVKIAEELKISSSLQIGQEITFDYDINITEEDDKDLASESKTLTGLTLHLSKQKAVEIIKENGAFIAKTTTIPLNKLISRSSIIIESNFIASLKKLGLASNSIVELTNAYSHQIDFQRQIQSGDTITVITEKFLGKDGKFSHHGKILYASLNLSGTEYNIYRYSMNNSNHSFFSEDGKGVKRSLLRTPVNLVRVSSHYGNRKHPTLGFTKMHKGVDFAAPVGTPIYAAGDGVVTEASCKSGYGRLVKIKHSSTLSTIYAHASKFASNLKIGSRVKQGQVIAYVGQTGRTTGPHLHYEVKIDGKNVNPMSIKTTPSIGLSGQELAKFKAFKKQLKALETKLASGIELAENEAFAKN